jgi:hypothetical protein
MRLRSILSHTRSRDSGCGWPAIPGHANVISRQSGREERPASSSAVVPHRSLPRTTQRPCCFGGRPRGWRHSKRAQEGQYRGRNARSKSTASPRYSGGVSPVDGMGQPAFPPHGGDRTLGGCRRDRPGRRSRGRCWTLMVSRDRPRPHREGEQSRIGFHPDVEVLPTISAASAHAAVQSSCGAVQFLRVRGTGHPGQRPFPLNLLP